MCDVSVCYLLLFSYSLYNAWEPFGISSLCPGSLIPSCAPQLCFHGAGTCMLVSCIGCMSLLQLCFPCESVQGQWNESFVFSEESRIINENVLYVVFVFLRGQDVWFVQFLSILELECHVPVLSVHGQFTAVHRTHGMQLPPENDSLEWWRAHLYETTRVQSPDKGAVSMAKMQAFPMSAHVPLLLCLAGKEGAGGPSVKGSGLWLVEQLSCRSLCPYTDGEAGRDSHLLWVTGGCAVLFSGTARMGAGSSQNPIWGWWCNPQHAVLTCHRNE